MIKVECCHESSEVIQKAREDLTTYLSECKRNNIPVLLLLSGGSALEIVREGFDAAALGPNVTVTVLDERYTKDSRYSNYAQLVECGFVEMAEQKGCKFIDTRVNNEETRDEIANKFGTALGEWIKQNPNGKIVATIGMGDDGHTAGIIPSAKNFSEIFANSGEKLVIGYTVESQPVETNERITTTFEFLAMIALGVMVVMGEKKTQAMDMLLDSNGDIFTTPARAWREGQGQVNLYTDLNVC